MAVVQGQQRFVLYSILGSSEDGVKIAYQSEHEATSTREVSAEATKDGQMHSLGVTEQEISVTSYLSTSEDVNKLKTAQENGEKVALWDVIAQEPNESDKYPATYYEAFLNEVGETAASDSGVEVSLTFTVTGGVGVRGETALNSAQAEAVQFAFREAVQTTESGTGA